jgi:hypothetical protein
MHVVQLQHPNARSPWRRARPRPRTRGCCRSAAHAHALTVRCGCAGRTGIWYLYMRIHICTRTCTACVRTQLARLATLSRGTEGFRTIHETRADGIGQRQGRTSSRQALTYALTALSTPHLLRCSASASSVAQRRAGRSKQAHEARGGARDLQVALSDVIDALVDVPPKCFCPHLEVGREVELLLELLPGGLRKARPLERTAPPAAAAHAAHRRLPLSVCARQCVRESVCVRVRACGWHGCAWPVEP